MNTGANPGGAKVLAQAVALGRAHDVLVKDVCSIGLLARQVQRQARESIVVLRGDCQTLSVVGSQPR
jgi:hypothetical protein